MTSTPTKPLARTAPNVLRSSTTIVPRAAGELGLTAEDIDAIGAELDAIRQTVLDDRGEIDATYIRRMVKLQRRLEVASRATLYLGFLPPFWLLGTAGLGVSKILDNMEIGHNIMHGQYDWMGDPAYNSQTFQWDTASPAEQWRHSHNVIHHTYTNIVGKDRDIGYGILRMDEDQPWKPAHLANPINATLLALFFEYGVALHDLETERIISGDRELDEELADMARSIGRNAGKQALKDYVLFPALTGPLFLPTLAANFTANIMRNVWAFTIIFCGHFPSGVQTFSEEETANESRGAWYVRQMLGSANITGGRLFHIMSGNLSHQIEHHLFPDLPARRYKDIAPQVQDICNRYGIPYNSGGLVKQFGSVIGKIVRLAFPTRRKVSAAAATA